MFTDIAFAPDPLEAGGHTHVELGRRLAGPARDHGERVRLGDLGREGAEERGAPGERLRGERRRDCARAEREPDSRRLFSARRPSGSAGFSGTSSVPQWAARRPNPPGPDTWQSSSSIAAAAPVASDFQLWNEQYDRDLADIFAVQSEIAESIQRALRVEILEAELERVRRKPTEDLTAYDASLQGSFEIQHFTPDANARARALFQRAVELDPDYAEAHAALGMTYFLEYGLLWSLDPELIERAGRHARRALELEPSAADGHRLLSQVEMQAGRHDEALAIAERAVELNPNDEFSWVLLAVAQFEVGSYLAAGQTLAATLRLNPRAPSAIWMFVGYVNAAVGRNERAVELWERVRAEYPRMVLARIPLVIYYEKIGRHADARTVAREILRTNPDITAEQAFIALPGHDTGLFGAADPAGDVENLRSAGLP